MSWPAAQYSPLSSTGPFSSRWPRVLKTKLLSTLVRANTYIMMKLLTSYSEWDCSIFPQMNVEPVILPCLVLNGLRRLQPLHDYFLAGDPEFLLQNRIQRTLVPIFAQLWNFFMLACSWVGTSSGSRKNCTKMRRILAFLHNSAEVNTRMSKSEILVLSYTCYVNAITNKRAEKQCRHTACTGWSRTLYNFLQANFTIRIKKFHDYVAASSNEPNFEENRHELSIDMH